MASTLPPDLPSDPSEVSIKLPDLSNPIILDSRSDDEILADLLLYKPIDATSKNIWCFWDRGLLACKPWCQRNIISWVRRHPNWIIRVLDMVDGSANNYSNYVPSTLEFFPQSFLNRTMSGTHFAPHAADLIRLPLLYLYGGIWIDVGFYLFRSMDDLVWDKLSDPGNDLEMAGFKVTIHLDASMFWNGFIAATKGSVIIKNWHDTFLKLWKCTNNGEDSESNEVISTAGMNQHPLLRHLPRYEVPSATGDVEAFAYEHFVDYIAQMFALERLRHVVDKKRHWDGPQVFAERVLLFECVTEVYWAQHLLNWDGRKQFELLSRLKSDVQGKDDLANQEAAMFVGQVLAVSSTMKLSHGIITEQREYLARIWDEPENVDADRKEGTWAEYLRKASVFYEQRKELVPVLFEVRDDALLTGDMFEEVGKAHSHWDSPVTPVGSL